MTEQGRSDTRCHGNGREHCCWIPGTQNSSIVGAVLAAGPQAGAGHIIGNVVDGVCPFLEADTILGRHWVCGKKRVLGTWDKVHRDKEYQNVVGSVLQARGTPLCGDWKVEGQCCFGSNNPPVYNKLL
jgi:hypothetical protein